MIKLTLHNQFRKAAVCAFSGYVNFPCRFNRGIRELSKIFCKVVFDGIENDSIQGRLNCFYAALEDPEVDVIFSLTGGYNSNDLLEKIDYNFVSKHPKPIVGFSDTTAIQLALLQKIGLPSFYGPAILSDFGAYGGLDSFTKLSLMQALTSKEPYVISPPKQITYSNDFWDKDDHVLPHYEPNTRCFSPLNRNNSTAEGILIGGNMNTLLALLGTPYFPDLKSAILFLEDCNTNLNKLRRDLNTLKQAGIFEIITGLVFAKFYANGMTALEQNQYSGFIENYFNEYNKPLLYQMDFGHHSPRITIPIGTYAKIDTKNGICLL